MRGAGAGAGGVAAAGQGQSYSMMGWRSRRRGVVDEVRVGGRQRRLDLAPGGGERRPPPHGIFNRLPLCGGEWQQICHPQERSECERD
jgi:hypothetical protein